MAWYGRDYGGRGWAGGHDPRDTGWSDHYADRHRPHGRMTFEPRDEYHRGVRAEVREGWRDLKRGVRDAFGRGYDREYRRQPRSGRDWRGWSGEGRRGSRWQGSSRDPRAGRWPGGDENRFW